MKSSSTQPEACSYASQCAQCRLDEEGQPTLLRSTRRRVLSPGTRWKTDRDPWWSNLVLRFTCQKKPLKTPQTNSWCSHCVSENSLFSVLSLVFTFFTQKTWMSLVPSGWSPFFKDSQAANCSGGGGVAVALCYFAGVHHLVFVFFSHSFVRWGWRVKEGKKTG